MSKTAVVAKLTDIPPGTCLTVEAAGITAVLFNVDGTLYALDNTCPHAGGPLGEGTFEGEMIQCPWHRWRYNVRTGEKLANPEFKVPCYRVETHGDAVHLIVPTQDEQQG
jgi:nitrite reductase (NADH) small subunit/3-phenylpropionate/trans-cinnamate dioxygenase ferredoxin subunit